VLRAGVYFRFQLNAFEGVSSYVYTIGSDPENEERKKT
jgi:hypothetical protein